ncbi:LppU family putative lipoprotein [Mycobacterium ulcerans]|uniref:Lipoprotein n=1 Tax=Mycobacterium ulcerans subsp. shinshuense TaxID=1124626 RepID=A0A1B4Y5G5_MYCUL|nr:lipoprotein [Mycobacterium ulcerans subsp. shinshuense]
MRALFLAVLMALAVPASGVLVGCSSTTKAADLAVGDCLKLAGPPDRPQATKAACGSEESNFKVVAVAKDGTDHTECPADVDSSYSSRNVLGGANSTLCLDVDWVLGSCMSVDPDHKTDPFRVGCNDASAPHRQRATQILQDVASPVTVDQCASGVGYTYTERRFVVCVEDVGGSSQT